MKWVTEEQDEWKYVRVPVCSTYSSWSLAFLTKHSDRIRGDGFTSAESLFSIGLVLLC